MLESAQMNKTAPQVRGPDHWVELIASAFGHGSYDGIVPLAQYVHPEFVGKAPQSPDAIGREGWLDFFAQLYVLAPDLKGQVLRSAATPAGDGVYVELRLTGTLKGRKLAVDVCDYFTLRDGLVIARVTYFDPLPLLLAIVSRPSAWPAWLRLQLGASTRKRADQSGEMGT